MKQALIALIRDTFTGKAADAQRTERQEEQHSSIRTLDLSELRQVSGGDSVVDSPKRGW